MPRTAATATTPGRLRNQLSPCPSHATLLLSDDNVSHVADWKYSFLLIRAARASTPVALAFALMMGLAAIQAQSTSPTIRGSWAATAVPNQVFQGTWTAQLVPDDPNTAQGSWTLLKGSNQIAAQGTWSAVKTARSWSGTWQARVVTTRGATGRLLSGSWRTPVADSDVRSLSELLQKTFREQVSGAWASGRLTGAWSLRGFQ
jgi:hypothetical protein